MYTLIVSDLHLTNDEDSIVLEVSDNGIGIIQNELNLVFEDRYRATSATELDIEGTGTGLHIVKEYVELMGGRVEIESTLGVGTTVRLVFPRSK